MKTLNEFILEELDNNLFWMLDKWFEFNPNQLSEFLALVAEYNKTKFNVKELELLLNDKLELKNQLQEFVNFVDNDIYPEDNKDYIQKLKDIIVQVTNNKSSKNKYTKKGNA